MEVKMDKKTFALCQMEMWKAYIMKDHAEIISGAYKQRKTEVGDKNSPSGWRPCTDEEKLENVMHTMTAHCNFLCEIVNSLEVEE